MKKNRWTSTHKFLKLGLPFYILLLFSLSSISNITVIHAADSPCFFICSPTPTPTSEITPTDTPTVIPTPTLIPTLTPTQRPQPTPVPQEQPTIPANVQPPVEPTMPETSPIVIPTDTPSVTATTVTTTVIVTVTPHTTGRTNITSTNHTADQGFNPVLLSLGVGIPLLLATGGIFWLLWRRQAQQYKPGTYPNAQVTPWMNNYAASPTLDPQYASSSATFAPGVSGALSTASTQPILLPQPTYTTTSDLHPAAPFSREMLTASLNNGASAAQNGSQPLLIDTPSLSPLSTSARAANKNGQITTTPLSPARMDTPPPSMSSLSPISPLAIHPPSIKDDPMLEEVMRQAQMGLFILSGR